MSVSAISSTDNPYQATGQTPVAQRRQAFQALGNALESGDLASAQGAFADLQNLPSPSGAPQSAPAGAVTTSLQTIGSDLQSGDLAGAQAAFAALQKSHGHHHHHHAQGQSAKPAGAAATGTANTPPVADGSTFTIAA